MHCENFSGTKLSVKYDLNSARVCSVGINWFAICLHAKETFVTKFTSAVLLI